MAPMTLPTSSRVSPEATETPSILRDSSAKANARTTKRLTSRLHTSRRSKRRIFHLCRSPRRNPNDRQNLSRFARKLDETGDPGQILEGYFDVRGGLLYVWNETDASPIGTTPIKPGDDPAVAARKLLREKSGKSSSFYQPIRYPRGSVH